MSSMKKKVRGISLLVMAVMALALMLTGCSKSEPTEANKPVTITFWHTQNAQETPTLEAIVKDFEAKNPNIKVEMQAVPFDGAQNKFKTAAQAGNAPDVFRSECAWTPEFAALGLLAPLDDLIKAEDKADFLPTAAASYQFKGKTYGLPQVTDALALLYNKRLFKEAGVEPPKTMDEFLAVAQKLTNKEKGQYGFAMRGGEAYWIQPFVWAFGGDLIDSKDMSVKINTPESVKGLQFVIDLKDKYGVMPNEMDFANDYQNTMVGFKSGKFAMILNGPWATTDLLADGEFKAADNLGIAPIPAGPDGKFGSPMGGHGLVISVNTKNREAAYKLIEFITAKENQAKFATQNNLLPTRKSAYDLDELKNNRIITAFKAVIEKATTRPVIPELGQIYTEFTPNYQAALAGKKTAQQAWDDVAVAWNKLLKK
jgi:arabinogalactan oligomer / maltooligosaccharide transport system substrate-binding protein